MADPLFITVPGIGSLSIEGPLLQQLSPVAFEYDPSRLVGEDAQPSTNLPEIALDLLEFMLMQFEENKKRPIVCLSCDIAGSILKEALIRARSLGNPKYNEVLDSITTLVFFGTPHRETPTQPWESTLLRMICYLQQRQDIASWLPKVISTLSLEHRRLCRGFESISNKYRIVQYAQDPESSNLILSSPLANLDCAIEETILANADYERLTRLSGKVHRDRYLDLLKESAAIAEPQYRSFLEMLRLYAPNSPGKSSQVALFAQTANAIFSQESPKEWLLSDASQPLVFQVPLGFINDDFHGSLLSHISGRRCGEFQRYTVISANLAEFRTTHPRTASTASLCNLIHQMIRQYPLLWHNIQSLFSYDELVSVFYGKSTCLLESVLWRSFAALLSANQPVACVLLVPEAGINTASLESFLERMVAVAGLTDCNYKLMVVQKIGAATAFRSPTRTSALDISDAHIKKSIDCDVRHLLDLVLEGRPETLKNIVDSLPTSYSDPLLLITLIRYIETRGLVSQLQIAHDLRLLQARDELFFSILNTIPDSGKATTRDILLLLTHAFRSLTTTELGVAVAIMARDGAATPVQDFVPLSIRQDLSTHLPCLVSVNCEYTRLAHPSLNNFLDPKQCTARPWYQPGPHPHLAMAKLCLQCIALHLQPQPQDIQPEDGPVTVAEQGKEEPVRHASIRESINPLLEYAVLNWPHHVLQGILDGAKETDVTSIINLLSDDGIVEWLRMWTELHCHMEPPHHPSPRLSPLELATKTGLPFKSALNTCLYALDSLAASERNEDIALVWGIFRAVGVEAAVKFWRDEMQQASREPNLLLSLFGLNPELAFELLKSVDKAFLDGHLPQLLSLDISFGNDTVLKYIIQQDLAVDIPMLRINHGEVCCEETSLPKDEDLHDVPPPQVDNRERHLSILGLAEFCGRAPEGLRALFRSSNAEINSTAMHAAVASGKVDATNALLSLSLDFDDGGTGATTAIHLASKYGFIKILEQLIPPSKGGNPHLPDEEGSTPLHLAARKGYIRVAKALLSHGASASAKDKMGDTPFLIAVDAGNLELVQLLFESCQQHEQPVPVDEPGHEGLTPIISAIANGFLKISNLLVQHGAKLDAVDSRGYNPLYLAAEHNFSDFLSTVLKDKAVHINQSSREDSLAALNIALSKGHAACVSAILENRPDQSTGDLLEQAVRQEEIEVVKVLLEKAQFDDHALGEALLYAALQGSKELVTLLLDAGANQDYKDSFNTTALQLAAYYNHGTAVEALLLRRPDLEIKDSEGRTALCDAARRGCREPVKLLLDAGADFNAKDDLGKTPFELAASEHKQAEMILILSKMRSQGASEDSVDEGELLRRMIEERLMEVVEYLLRRDTNLVSPRDLQAAVETKDPDLDLVSMLLKYGADPNSMVDEDFGLPIHYAAEMCNCRLVEVLLEGKADVNKTGGYSWSALYSCVSGPKEDDEKTCMFDLLIANGADPLDTSGNYGTVLHMASQYCSRELVRHLLEGYSEKLSLHTEDREGRLPAHFVASRGNNLIFDLVLKPVVNARDKQLRMPIHMAAARGSLRALEYILQESAVVDLCETDVDGWNVLHWACRQRDRDVVEWIMEQVTDNEALQRELSTAKTTPEAWLPSDVAMLHNNQRFLEIIVPPNQKEQEEPGDTIYGPVQVWDRTYASCNSCFAAIYGTRHKCLTCVDFDFCFKCFKHVDDIHDTSHKFEIRS